MEHLHAEVVRDGWSREVIPCLACVSGIPEFLAGRDEVSSIRTVGVHVKGSEKLSRHDLLPSVAFIGRLPYGAITESDEDRLNENCLVTYYRSTAFTHRFLLEV